jgi:CheY-like chemotaxis protein
MEYILYCEDEFMVNMVLTKTLQECVPSREVISTTTVEDALRHGLEKLSELSMIITDGSLPDGRGWNMVTRLRDQGFSGPAIYTGLTPLPDEYCGLFAARIPKGPLDPIVEYVTSFYQREHGARNE